MSAARILLIDDEPAILDMIALVLRKEGFVHVETAATGSAGVDRCRTFEPQAIVLDVMLPDMDGFEVCRRCREMTDAPILFLTARGADLDKLMGFGVGGDDYITKPFNPLEVAARIQARLRRHAPPAEGSPRTYDFGRFRVIEASAELLVDSAAVICPAREFQLLLFLCRNPNRVFSRAQLYERVWGEASLGDDITVAVHVRRLREKIEPDPGNPRYLQTVRGLGYKLVHPHRD